MATLPTITEDYIIKGVPKTFTLNHNIGDFLINCLKARAPSSIALVDSITKAEVSVAKLLNDTAAVGLWLREQGIAFGDCVGFCAENRMEYVPTVLATLSIGATCAPLNPIYTVGEMKHILSISEPKIVFCNPAASEKIKETLRVLPLACNLVIFDDGTGKGHKSDVAFNDILYRPQNTSSFCAAKLSGETSVGVILCSSGTTGLPKCVELTHGNLTCFVETLLDIRVTGELNARDTLLALPPFFHGFGFGLMLLSLSIGIKLVTFSKFSEVHFLETMETFKVTLLFVVPPILVLLAKHALVTKYNLSSLRMIRCGAAPLSRDLQTAVKIRLGINDVEQAYGMTEASIACVFVPQGSGKEGSSGVITPGMDCKVIDVESGKPLKPFQEGEICFKGPFLMKGYRHNKRATDETIDNEGWLHTGDLGYYDAQGFLYIVDRLKELIKVKGFQVAPAEIEAILITHPSVKDAAVIGIPDEKAGELPFAFIVLQPAANISSQQIQSFIAAKVSPQKRLTGGVKFVKEIPKNQSGKILRRILRENFRTSSKL